MYFLPVVISLNKRKTDVENSSLANLQRKVTDVFQNQPSFNLIDSDPACKQRLSVTTHKTCCATKTQQKM